MLEILLSELKRMISWSLYIYVFFLAHVKFLFAASIAEATTNLNFTENCLIKNDDSDAIISKGIISLLIRVFSGHSPQDILDADINFIEKIGLDSHLSQTRANGLLSMIKQIKIYALAYQAKQ